jgi:putative sigma-54 modulation protein
MMKVVYTGKTKEFTPQLEKKVEAKLSKLGKMIEQRGEREAHLFHQEERHLHKVEVKLNFYDHQLSAASADADLLTAVTEAVDKLDKQIIKLRTKWRDTHRDSNGARATKEKLIAKADQAVETARNGKPTAAAQVAAKSGRASTGPTQSKPKLPVTKAASGKKTPKIYKVDHGKGQKPMSLEEAVLSLDDGEDYVVYRDIDKDSVAVLVRRRDGHLDLIES